MYFFSYLEPVCCSMSSSNCCFLTCIQVSQEAGQVVWCPNLFRNFPQSIVIRTVKGFGMVNKAEIGVFSGILLLFWWSSRCWQFDLWFLCLVLNPAWTSGSSQFTYYWSLTWRILSITLLACEMCAIVRYLSILWHCLSLGLEWKLTFSSPVATAEFSKFAGILSVALSQHHLSAFEIAQLEFHHLH